MRFVIAYDVASDRRRNAIAKLLLSFGERVQYSVFECDLSPQRLALLQARLSALIHPKKDRVNFYPLCQACFAKAASMGKMIAPVPDL